MKHPYHLINLIWRLLPVTNIQFKLPVDTNTPGHTLLKQLGEKSNTTEQQKPELEKPQRSLSTYVRSFSRIPLRDRALIMLRSAHLQGAFNLSPALTHCAIDHGLSTSDIELIKVGHQAPGWSKQESLVIRTVDNLHQHQQISLSQWRALSRTYDTSQIFDLMIYSAAFHLSYLSDQ